MKLWIAGALALVVVLVVGLLALRRPPPALEAEAAGEAVAAAKPNDERGTPVFLAAHPDGAGERQAVTRAPLGAQGSATGATLMSGSNSQDALVRGRVLGPEGAGRAGCLLRAKEVTTLSGARGSFELRVPVATEGENVVLRARDEGLEASLELALSPAQVVDACELLLETARTGVIEGSVVDANGAAMEGVQVALDEIFNFFDSGNDPSVLSDARGQFRFEDVVPGVHTVKLADSGTPPPEHNRRALAEVEAGATSYVVLGGPSRSVFLSGRIVGLPPEQEDLELIALLDGPNSGSEDQEAHVASAGRFEFKLPGPGSYWLVLDRDNQLISFPMVEVPAPGRSDVELRLPSGRIEGTLLDAQGRPLEGARVRLGRDEHARWIEPSLFEGVSTAADGTFTFIGVEPGAYLLHAESTCAVAVRVAPDGVASGVLLRQSDGGTLRGKVLDAAGAPVKDAEVFAFDAAGRWHVGDARGEGTGEDGRIELGGLPPGEYRVSARLGKQATPPSEPLRVVADATVYLELRLQAATMLEVSLRDRRGTLVPALWSLRDATGCNHAGILGTSDLLRLLANGPRIQRPRFGPLAPGTYRVEALGPDGRIIKDKITLAGERELRLELRLER